MSDKCIKTAALYVASLKGLSLILQHCHWTTRGLNFYGEHLLFERLYKQTLEDLDMAAEKFIGVLGETCLHYDAQTELLGKILEKYSHLEGSPTQMCLAIERDVNKLGEDFYHLLKTEGEITLGLDDFLMAANSSREGAIYLLQQSLTKE